MLQAREISVPTSSRSAFPRALKKIAFPRARVPKTPGTRERELRNARPALQLQIGSGTQIRNAKQNWVRGSAGTLTLVCEEIYLKRNAGARRATAKCRSAGTRHAKGLQELAPSSANDIIRAGEGVGDTKQKCYIFAAKTSF